MYEQIIYYGAPGTGKSHLINEKTRIISRHKIFRVTIHPEFTYSDFIGQILPQTNDNNQMDFKFINGPFTNALVEAFSNNDQKVYLILEELSRGNVSAIFGDIFQLLDRDELGKSKFPVRNSNIASKIVQLLGDDIYLPSNFNILCTANTNDQNVFPMDTAFKRRFNWEYISSYPALDLDGNILSRLNNPRIIVNSHEGDLETNWLSFYSALNDFITDIKDGMGKNEDKQVGQFFIEFDRHVIENSYNSDLEIAQEAKNNINKLIKNKLLYYLWDDVQGNNSFDFSKSLFKSEIISFSKLFSSYGNSQVFSDDFINLFVRPNANRYIY